MQLSEIRGRHAAAGLALLTGIGASAVPVQGQDTANAITIHGYLTQAYGRTDRLPINGLPKDGTSDLRVMALQTRYAMTPEDQIVVQIRNRRLGEGVSGDNGVVLDWAYYRHDFGSASVKVGKVPFTLGIYNELRLVGTVLPFFRAPSVFYLPGIETIDGISGKHQLPLGPWSLESNAYWGGETVVTPIVIPTGIIALTSRNDNIFGAQEWLNTPLQGLRVGAAFHRFKSPTGDAKDTVSNNLFAGSLDGTFDRFLVRGEYMQYAVRRGLPGNLDLTVANYYGQAGVKVLEPLWLNAQWEIGKSNAAGLKYQAANDAALGVSYSVSPELVLKLEGHAAKGYSFDKYLPPNGPAGKTKYGIASIAASF